MKLSNVKWNIKKKQQWSFGLVQVSELIQQKKFFPAYLIKKVIYFNLKHWLKAKHQRLRYPDM